MTKLCRALFKYENKMEIGQENQCKSLWFTQMRFRVEKGDFLGCTMSNTQINQWVD